MPYIGSFISDTPKQQYKILNLFIDDACARNDRMEQEMTVHLPYGCQLEPV